ncbi:uncharacterized protein L969DRAFT_17504 [Mixia osmundae IAM 14324]|uniref:Pre-mRNA-splicing factor CEF1 n=1 Tax=Mixia osmundae (strain CBS 9802 / IAM 14324 / JCM 22182 / KY 12970) TaxID=764103 RepID=G7DVX4_MIXOS|nr:uncharacterized protein L969DRAFT_17504 [Mixia osmundae IAM 14324]KEI39584.1 hypothetical protein L969DRAFT_17504 [Mixia osmundae IAM 14324]GAA94734.1 hypothetical protein E5Q_01388 [Mixia osmundae IAM 14324]
MRIIVKGGIWKNTEDEILKAAVSKYGKNQWARISSLLVRKTPKQCKARWYEWLDPSIKKVEFSKDEDEKLLHLAKLMPTQWRTIAPIVGRTATQCLERYQKLLDDAEQRDNEELGLTGVGAEAGPSADDVRRLRPGEVDPDPETRAARPDPIDMDEDEKEMLSEARARLANTQGKKAKRKARERQLEEARRLAMLQKKRELKAAGIGMRTKHKGGMDYNADIPFEKRPAPGFYDTTDEANRPGVAPVGKSLQQLEGKRKKDDEEEDRRKRQKRAAAAAANPDGAAMAHFVAEKDAQIQRMKEQEQISRRRRLDLPTPQVGEVEIEQIVKLGQAGETARTLVDDASNEASKGLLGEEASVLDSVRTARTPRTAPQADTVLNEARNLRNLTAQQTPLLGDENTPLHEIAGRGSGFEGATPQRQVSATPNPLATPLRSARGPGPGETPRDEKRRLQSGRDALKAGFMRLPAPKNDFELVDPSEPSESDSIATMRPEDAAERDERQAAYLAEEQRKHLARRSQAIKKDLPRPTTMDATALLAGLDKPSSDRSLELERLVTREMVLLLHNDAHRYPVAGGLRPDAPMPVDDLSDEALASARAEVHKDLAGVFDLPGATEAQLERLIGSSVDHDRFQATWSGSKSEFAYSGASQAYLPISDLSEDDRKAGLAALLEQCREKMTSDAARAAKTEKKLAKTLGGYQARSRTLGDKLVSSTAELETALVDLATFERLALNEDGSIARRIESLTTDVEKLTRIQQEAQVKYRDLELEHATIQQRIADAEEELAMREAEAINEAAMAEQT